MVCLNKRAAFLPPCLGACRCLTLPCCLFPCLGSVPPSRVCRRGRTHVTTARHVCMAVGKTKHGRRPERASGAGRAGWRDHPALRRHGGSRKVLRPTRFGDQPVTAAAGGPHRPCDTSYGWLSVPCLRPSTASTNNHLNADTHYLTLRCPGFTRALALGLWALALELWAVALGLRTVALGLWALALGLLVGKTNSFRLPSHADGGSRQPCPRRRRKRTAKRRGGRFAACPAPVVQ